MKNLFRLLIINLVIVSLLSFFVTAVSCGVGGPDIGITFDGYAKYSGSVLDGKTVTATTDDESVSATTESNGFYRLVVTRCSGSGDTVSFTVCTRSAAESGTYSEGATTSLNLTISSACPTTTTSSGGGGGGGSSGSGGAGGAAVAAETNLDGKSDFTTTGATVKQTQGDTVTFTVGGTEYTAEVTKLKDDSITIDVAGKTAVLVIGAWATFDVDGDGTDDLTVTLKGIDGGRAEVVYKGVDSGMMALLTTIRAFYSGTSDITMMDLLDKIRAFYGG